MEAQEGKYAPGARRETPGAAHWVSVPMKDLILYFLRKKLTDDFFLVRR